MHPTAMQRHAFSPPSVNVKQDTSSAKITLPVLRSIAQVITAVATNSARRLVVYAALAISLPLIATLAWSMDATLPQTVDAIKHVIVMVVLSSTAHVASVTLSIVTAAAVYPSITV